MADIFKKDYKSFAASDDKDGKHISRLRMNSSLREDLGRVTEESLEEITLTVITVMANVIK